MSINPSPSSVPEPSISDYPSILRQGFGAIYVPKLSRTLDFRLINTEATPIEFGEKLPPLETAIFDEAYTSFVYHTRVELDHLLTATFEIIPSTD